MSSSSGEGVLDSLKNATGLGEPTYTGQAKQGAHDLKESAKSEYNSVSQTLCDSPTTLLMPS